MSTGALTPFRQKIIDGATTIGSSQAIDVAGYTCFTFYTVGTGTINAGVVTFEEAPCKEYNGTWASITTANAADVTDGKTKAYRMTLADNAVGAIKARISTNVGGGGSLDVWLVAV